MQLATALLAQLATKDDQLARRDSEIKFKDAKIERITFELARLKAWKFGAKTEAMNAEQRQMFEDTMTEDEADLQAQLQTLQGDTAPAPPSKRQPRREKLPEHLRRVEHRHEPENTHCPTPACGQPMVRIGEDVSERLDIVPAEFFVHRHIRSKWVCKCCQQLVQEPVEPQIIDKGMPSAGLIAHTLVARFVDHLPYYRQEAVNARSGVHTPRSTLASWSGAGGASLMPLYEAHRAFILSAPVLHADETPVRMLVPGTGKTAKAVRGLFHFCRSCRGWIDYTGAKVQGPTWLTARGPVEMMHDVFVVVALAAASRLVPGDQVQSPKEGLHKSAPGVLGEPRR